MRIAVLAHNTKTDNGTGVFTSHLISGLKNGLGAEVIALTTLKNESSKEKAILPHNLFKFIVGLPKIRQEIKTCDVVHAMDVYPYGIIGVLASLGLKKKIIITAIGTGSVGLLYNKKIILTRLAIWAYRSANVVTAISRFTKKLIAEKISNLNIHVITPGVDPGKFEHHVQNNEIQKLKPYVLSVGAIRWRKGYKRSIRAFAKVREKFPEMKYVIVGRRYPGPYYDELQRIIRELHLEDSVIFLSDINSNEELASLYQNAEVFCLLSQQYSYDVEGFGIVFLEAAAAGLPVVGGTESGIEDAVQNGKNGFLVDWEDKNGELAEKLIAILGNKDMHTKMSIASREWAKSSSWENRMREYMAIYKGL